MLFALFWSWISVYFSLLTSYVKIRHYTKEIYKSKSRNSINIDVHTVENGKINNIIPRKYQLYFAPFLAMDTQSQRCIFISYPRNLNFAAITRSSTSFVLIHKKTNNKTIHYIYSVLIGRFISITIQLFMTTTDQLSQTDTFRCV